MTKRGSRQKESVKKLEKEWLEDEKQISLELEWAEKRKVMLEKKENELMCDELKLEKEYDITMRILKSAHAQMD